MKGRLRLIVVAVSVPILAVMPSYGTEPTPDIETILAKWEHASRQVLVL